jgi:hypothetical protein
MGRRGGVEGAPSTLGVHMSITRARWCHMSRSNEAGLTSQGRGRWAHSPTHPCAGAVPWACLSVIAAMRNEEVVGAAGCGVVGAGGLLTHPQGP